MQANELGTVAPPGVAGVTADAGPSDDGGTVMLSAPLWRWPPEGGAAGGPAPSAGGPRCCCCCCSCSCAKKSLVLICPVSTSAAVYNLGSCGGCGGGGGAGIMESVTTGPCGRAGEPLRELPDGWPGAVGGEEDMMTMPLPVRAGRAALASGVTTSRCSSSSSSSTASSTCTARGLMPCPGYATSTAVVATANCGPARRPRLQRPSPRIILSEPLTSGCLCTTTTVSALEAARF